MKKIIQFFILFLEYGCFGEILETDRECFVADTGNHTGEYLPEHIKCKENIVLRGHNLSIIRTDTFCDLQCDSLSLRLNNIEVIHPGAFSSSSITVLDLSENLLKCIFYDSVQVKGLETLDLSKNRLTYIEPDSFSLTLTSLDLSFNNISIFDIEHFPNLENIRQLSLAHNSLSSVVLRKDILTNLESLDLSNNNLHQYNFSGLVSLTYLNLKNNKLKCLQKSQFLALDNLEELDLSDNKLEDALIMNNSFPKLVTLKLQNNNIKEIQDNLFSTSSNLGYLDVSGNCLQYFNFSNNQLRNLWLLKMNNIELVQIHASLFLIFSTLYELELSNNSLTEFNGDFNVPTLWRLDLSYNRLTKIENNFMNLKELRSLDLSHNYINSIDISNCSLEKIRKIKLNNNNIRRIRDRSLPNLKTLLYLDLSSNQLKTFEISEDKLPRLRYIDVSFNKLFYFDDDTFSYFGALRFLSLRNNLISQVPPKVFYDNVQLLYLDLSYNLITSFKYNQTSTKTSLKTFNIFGNPINCIHLQKIEEYSGRNQIELNNCDSHCRGDGRTPICVNYGCDCVNNNSTLTAMYLQNLLRNDIRNCSFYELAHNGV